MPYISIINRAWITCWLITLRIYILFMLYEEFFMKKGWEWASNVVWLPCENKWLLRDIPEGHQTRTETFCFQLPRDTDNHSTRLSHSESLPHLKNGVSRNFHHRYVDDSFRQTSTLIWNNTQNNNKLFKFSIQINIYA